MHIMEGTAKYVVEICTAQVIIDCWGCALQGPETAAAARQKEVFQALARFCSQVSGEAIIEDQVKHFRFRDWRRFTQVSHPSTQAPCCHTDPLSFAHARSS